MTWIHSNFPPFDISSLDQHTQRIIEIFFLSKNLLARINITRIEFPTLARLCFWQAKNIVVALLPNPESDHEDSESQVTTRARSPSNHFSWPLEINADHSAVPFSVSGYAGPAALFLPPPRTDTYHLFSAFLLFPPLLFLFSLQKKSRPPFFFSSMNFAKGISVKIYLGFTCIRDFFSLGNVDRIYLSFTFLFMSIVKRIRLFFYLFLNIFERNQSCGWIRWNSFWKWFYKWSLTWINFMTSYSINGFSFDLFIHLFISIMKFSTFDIIIIKKCCLNRSVHHTPCKS